MTDKLYTPENCKLVEELVAKHFPELSRNFVGCTDEWLSDVKSAPELIREALAKDGLIVYQNHDRPMLELREIGGGDTAVFFDKNWNDTDPTFRHRLFAATVEYLEGKK